MSDISTTATDVIPFRSAKLLLVNCGGQPFVPMKPVVEGMGLDWKTQHRKLVDGRFKSTMVEMTIVAADGKLRPMVCLPLRKLAGWLMSIHPEKIKDEDRKRLILDFQDECDDVLWSYWNEGVAVRAHDRDATTVISELIGMSELNVITALIRDKAKAVPAAMQQSFALTMHRRLHTRFNVPRTKLIPASQFDQACNFIGSYALEGEYLERPAVASGRLEIHQPLDSLTCRRPAMLVDRGDGHAWLDVKISDLHENFRSPCEAVLCELTRQGYDVTGAWWEVRTLRNKLREFQSWVSGMNVVLQEPKRYAVELEDAA